MIQRCLGSKTITQSEIEAFAVQIAEPDFKTESIEPLIGHLYGADVSAVLDRAAEIAREYAKAAFAEADATECLVRLANAAGCPDSESVIPWLLERGLIEKVEDGWRFKTAKPEVSDRDDIPF
jgi:hypothetical protein